MVRLSNKNSFRFMIKKKGLSYWILIIIGIGIVFIFSFPLLLYFPFVRDIVSLYLTFIPNLDYKIAFISFIKNLYLVFEKNFNKGYCNLFIAITNTRIMWMGYSSLVQI